MKSQTFHIAAAQSSIDWVGRKVTGAHNGTISIKEGTLLFNEDQLAGGRFIIDTTSIVILDVTDPATNAQFAGHLASPDFFASVQFPEAIFEISSAKLIANNRYDITGRLTIKNITHPVRFDAQVDRQGNTLRASGKIVVDRTLYGMRFRSGNFFKDLGDTLIYNDFELQVNLTAKAVAQTAVA